jgi:hypothetical protein
LAENLLIEFKEDMKETVFKNLEETLKRFDNFKAQDKKQALAKREP